MQGRLHSIIHSLVSKRERPAKLCSPHAAVHRAHRSLCLFIRLSLFRHAVHLLHFLPLVSTPLLTGESGWLLVSQPQEDTASWSDKLMTPKLIKQCSYLCTICSTRMVTWAEVLFLRIGGVVCPFSSSLTIKNVQENRARHCCPQQGWNWHLRQNQCL